MNKHPRFDFIFSYWIYIWFIVYKLRLTNYNPKLFLIGAFLENLLYLFLMLYYHNSFIYIGLFIIINLFIKVFPLWLLWKTPTDYKSDILFGLFLMALYFVWLIINKVNFKQSFISSYNGIKNNQPITPFIYYVLKYT
jgi:hypothetical protein